MDTETLVARSGLKLLVGKRTVDQDMEVTFRTDGDAGCVLHWGVRPARKPQWQLPPSSIWPEGTYQVGQTAAQTPFAVQGGESRIILRLNPAEFPIIEFALFYPKEGRWDNNGGKNYHIRLAQPATSAVRPAQALKAALGEEQACSEQLFALNDLSQLAVAVTKEEHRYRVRVLTDLSGAVLLHWGLARDSGKAWLAPPESVHPAGTMMSQSAAETPFTWLEGLNRVEILFEEEQAPFGMQFVLRQGETGVWVKDRGQNFFVPIKGESTKAAGPVDAGVLSRITQQIIEAEMGDHSWTLMHRFNLCHELMDQVDGSLEGMALLFVWLRFSAVRQLTWQRNYNTKPRELSHAEERLTQKLAATFRQEPAARPWLRLMLTTVGRGGEGQKVRDEILNIMHRHHIKEVSGHFLEEWHQKLHNNTTPDDIVICEGYLEFLRSDGQAERFYQTLRAAGVTKERLESFERPIKSAPTFHPHLKMGLLHDFENFLRILKSVHAGTDLETAINIAKGQLDGDTQNLLASLWQQHNDPKAPPIGLVEQITTARQRLAPLLANGANARDLLYLDLALEQLVRTVVEKNIHLRLPGEQLAELLSRVLGNLILSNDDPELAVCLRHWQRLKTQRLFEPEGSLHAKAVLDRVARALSRTIDSTYQLLQPKAEQLGQAFKAEAWTITLFSEEVVRGSSLGFVLSMLLHHLEPLLRKAAKLGNWQIISRGKGQGLVDVVDSLSEVQGKTYDRPAVIIANSVRGDEEIPPGVTAVIAPDVTDVVSHVAVRARNANLLFASCYDLEMLKRLKSLHGRHLTLEVNAAGDVVFQEVPASATGIPVPVPSSAAKPRRVKQSFTSYAITLNDFTDELVGKKSFNQRLLREKLPASIHQPRSVALPFGTFEKVLSLEQNKAVAERYEALIGQLGAGKPRRKTRAKADNSAALTAASPSLASPAKRPSEAAARPASQLPSAEVVATLSELRQALLKLAAPAELTSNLRQVMEQTGLHWPGNWEDAWMRIKQVWASKWNDRAYWSRQAMGMAHGDLRMAVLIQEVVEAEYAFVIHTANPLNGNRDELFAEVVLGLGETLVGNYPGRALSMTCNKQTGEPTLLAYPAKSLGLYGRGLIFRSDSNGEDLAGFAGAGLYDSILLQPPTEVLLDYSEEPLVWDAEFRKRLFKSIRNRG